MFNKRDVLFNCGFVLAILATLFHVIGMATPHWLESHDEIRSTFDRLGLWSACFHNFAYDLDYLGKTYDGCHWIYSYEYKPIFDWLNPGWLVLVQVLMVIALIVDFFLLCMMSIQKVTGGFNIKNRSISVLTNSAMMFISATFTGFSLSLFGIQARVSRQWMPRPDQNFLAWSYGLAVVSGFFAVFSTMCLFTESQRLRFDEQNKAKKAMYKEHEGSAFPGMPQGHAVPMDSYHSQMKQAFLEDKRPEFVEQDYGARPFEQQI